MQYIINHNLIGVKIMSKKYVEIIDTSRELLKSFGYFVDNLWHVDDIHFICEQKKLPHLTDKQAMEVFMMANRQFDGENGLGWPQLENALNIYMQRKTLLCDTMAENDNN